MEQHKCCGAVVFHDNKLLIIQGAQGKHWGLPKGHVEADETEEQTALREVKEETGLTVAIVPGFRKTLTYQFAEGEKQIRKQTVVFVATAKTSKYAVDNKEISQALWATPSDALKKVTFQSVHDVLAEAITFAQAQGIITKEAAPKAEAQKSCGIIVLFKGKVLLVKQERSVQWGFPKCESAEDETEEQTAVRCVAEEAGLDVTLIPGFKETINYTYRERSNRVDKETVFFLANATDGKCDEKDGVTCKWFHPHDAFDKITFEEVKEVLKRALEVAR